MKKSVVESMLAYLNGENVNVEELKEAIISDLNRQNEKVMDNMRLYESAKDIVINAMPDTPISVADLYEKVKDDLPEGFSKSKVQYGLLNTWKDCVRKIEQPRGANLYMKI